MSGCDVIIDITSNVSSIFWYCCMFIIMALYRPICDPDTEINVLISLFDNNEAQLTGLNLGNNYVYGLTVYFVPSTLRSHLCAHQIV